jgi:hypothetical protein
MLLGNKSHAMNIVVTFYLSMDIYLYS